MKTQPMINVRKQHFFEFWLSTKSGDIARTGKERIKGWHAGLYFCAALAIARTFLNEIGCGSLFPVFAQAHFQFEF